MIDLFKPVSVTAGGRLHFGFLSFGNRMTPEFGGVGMMVKEPQVRLRVDPALRFRIIGDKSRRVAQFADIWARRNRPGKELRCAITLEASIPAHRGLGSGTQLALAVAKGLGRYYGCDVKSPEDLAATVGRGRRSAVGTFGFAEGGLLVDGGRTIGQPLGSLQQRLPVPEEWRFLLIEPDCPAGLSGERENHAFASLPPVAKSVTDDLSVILEQEIIAGLQSQDVNQFGEGLYQYGYRAGQCFAPTQGGAFANAEITSLVKRLRSWGVAGVGQSSWGPTVFALAADQKHAELLADRLREDLPTIPLRITGANNAGAVVRTVPPNATTKKSRVRQ